MSSELFRRGLVLRHELGDDAGLAECLEGLAGGRAATEDWREAAALLGAASALREVTGSPGSAQDAEAVAGLVATGQAALGDGDFYGQWEIGRQLSSDEVVAFAARREYTDKY